MKKIKTIYKIISTIILLSGIVLLYYLFCNKIIKIDNLISASLGFIAILTSVLSLAYSDPKISKLNLNLELWSKFDQPSNMSFVFFRIINIDKNPIYDMVITSRFPENIVDTMERGGENISMIRFSEMVIFSSDKIAFISAKSDKNINYITFKQKIGLKNWNENDSFFITLSAKSRSSKTFVISHNKLDSINKAIKEKSIIIT